MVFVLHMGKKLIANDCLKNGLRTTVENKR